MLVFSCRLSPPQAPKSIPSRKVLAKIREVYRFVSHQSPSKRKKPSEKEDITDSQENMNFMTLREDYQLLQEQKRNLELDIKSFKQDTETNVAVGKENSKRIIKLQEIEHTLRNQLEELDTKYSALKEKNRILVEEKCELEEAENDSRLQAQR